MDVGYGFLPLCEKTLSISLNKRIKAHTTKSINPLRGIIIPNIYLLLENDRFSVYTENGPVR